MHQEQQPQGLRQGTLGIFSLVFFVVAAASPLTGIVGGLPIAMLLGNGAGMVTTYIMASIILYLFSVGYITMSRYVNNAGAFYAYITSGMGNNTGTSASFVALFSYVCIQMAVIAMLGFFLNIFIAEHLHIQIAWWQLSFVVTLLVWMMSVRKIEVGGKLLGVLMLCEIAVVLLLDGSILTQVKTPFVYDGFKPTVFLDGNLGIAFVFAIASFVGFESTAIYSEECREPKKTVPRATIIALLVIAVFFCFSSWSLSQVYPVDQIKAIAAKDPGNFVFTIAQVYLGRWSVDVMNVLLITSLFAAALAFHNNISRYLFSIAREGIIWKELSSVHKEHGTPHCACHAYSVLMLVLLTVMGLLGLDPILHIFSFGSALATLGILLLQAGVSLSVILYFRRNASTGETRFNTRYAPIVSLITMVLTILLVMDNFTILTGNNSIAGEIVPLMVVLIIPIGYTWSKYRNRALVPSRL